MKEFGFMEKEHEDFPPIVHVETTNVCNLRCIHCPHNDIYAAVPDYSPEYMPMELWKTIVDEVSQFNGALRITPDGEPMLKNFVEQVDYALTKGVNTFTFNTHVMFLEKQNLEVLLQPTETKVVVEVSLDGFFKQTYEGIRLRGDYNRILGNIFKFIRERDRRKRDNVKLMVSIVQQPEVDDEELYLFDKFWSQIVDKVIIRNYVDTKGLTPKKDIDSREIETRWPCLVVFTRMVVTYDGRVRFCPDDWQKSTSMGKIDGENSLQRIWQSSEFKALRQSHLDGSFAHPTCKSCTDWKVIRWGKDYTTALEKVFNDNAKQNDSKLNILNNNVDTYRWTPDLDMKS